MIARWLRLLAAGAALGFAASTGIAAQEIPVPPLAARVTDLTGTLSAEQTRSIEQSLRDFERSRGSQIAVLMLPTTGPDSIEQYSIRVAEAWKIGRARVDDGIILVIARDDRKLRIEVGRGLEGAIPDVVAKRVIREIIAPHFLADDFHGGIADGVRALMKLVEGEQLPAPRGQSASKKSSGDYEAIFVVILVLATVLGRMLTAVAGRATGSSLMALVAGGAAWFITGAVLVAVIAAVIAFVIALMSGATAGRHFGGGGGGWSGGSDWSGGGGFSGGGGDFGGGGASGSWGD